MIEKYYTQKHHAKDRGIEWHFTYDTWLEWWGEDITKRGTLKGQLVMSRYNDTGHYHPSNVRKATVEENIIEGQLGNDNAAKQIKTPRGVFNSRIEAAKAFNVNVSTIRKRLMKYPAEYFYL